MKKPAFGRFRKRNFKTKAALGETPVEMLSDASSILAISTIKSARSQNGFGLSKALKTVDFQGFQRFLETDTDAYKYHIKVKNWGFYWGFLR